MENLMCSAAAWYICTAKSGHLINFIINIFCTIFCFVVLRHWFRNFLKIFDKENFSLYGVPHNDNFWLFPCYLFIFLSSIFFSFEKYNWVLQLFMATGTSLLSFFIVITTLGFSVLINIASFSKMRRLLQLTFFFRLTMVQEIEVQRFQIVIHFIDDILFYKNGITIFLL